MGKHEFTYKIPKQHECPCYKAAEARGSKGQLMDLAHPEGDICKINKTAFCKMPNYYEKWRPPQGKYLDYDLTQTDAKMAKGEAKVHLISTVASYGELNPNPPPPPPPPPPPKKIVYFHGKDPCWEFVEEKYYRQQMEKQKIYKRRLKKMARNRRRLEYLERKIPSDNELKIKEEKINYNEKFWSKLKAKLDPGIEKAKERYAKIQKVNELNQIQQFDKPGIPCSLLQKMKDNAFFHGKPPCWIYLDEIWFEKYEEQQEFYKERLKKIARNRKNEDRIRRYFQRLEEQGLL